LGAAHQAGGGEHGAGDVGLGIEPAGVDRGLQAAEIDDLELAPEQILEAALGQPAVQRHLAALEALDGDAGARLLALDAAARGLAQTRADAASEALLAAPRPRIVADLVQPHRRLLRGPWGPTPRPAPDDGRRGSCRAPRAYPRARGCGAVC